MIAILEIRGADGSSYWRVIHNWNENVFNMIEAWIKLGADFKIHEALVFE